MLVKAVSPSKTVDRRQPPKKSILVSGRIGIQAVSVPERTRARPERKPIAPYDPPDRDIMVVAAPFTQADREAHSAETIRIRKLLGLPGGENAKAKQMRRTEKRGGDVIVRRRPEHVKPTLKNNGKRKSIALKRKIAPSLASPSSSSSSYWKKAKTKNSKRTSSSSSSSNKTATMSKHRTTNAKRTSSSSNKTTKTHKDQESIPNPKSSERSRTSSRTPFSPSSLERSHSYQYPRPSIRTLHPENPHPSIYIHFSTRPYASILIHTHPYASTYFHSPAINL